MEQGNGKSFFTNLQVRCRHLYHPPSYFTIFLTIIKYCRKLMTNLDTCLSFEEPSRGLKVKLKSADWNRVWILTQNYKSTYLILLDLEFLISSLTKDKAIFWIFFKSHHYHMCKWILGQDLIETLSSTWYQEGILHISNQIRRISFCDMSFMHQMCKNYHLR